MGLRVNTNIAAMAALRNLTAVTDRVQKGAARLSSGLRIANAADDAAGLGVSERMRARIRTYKVAGRNAQDGVSLVRTAEGALQEVSNGLVRLRELAIRAATSTLNATDRATLDAEFQERLAEIQRISVETGFNGVKLLDGSATSLAIHVGADAYESITLALASSGLAALGIHDLRVTTRRTALAAQVGLDAAIDRVATHRGRLGIAQNRMLSTVASLASARENLVATESRIRDLDFAAEIADLTRDSILQEAAVSVLVQTGVQPELALTLLT